MDVKNSIPKNIPATSYSLAAVITLLAGIIISIFLSFMVKSWEQAKVNRTFDLTAQNYFSAIRTEVIRHEEVVNSISGLFSSSKYVSRNEFRIFVQDSLINHPDIQALSWNPVIRRSEQDKFIQMAREDGFTDFTITELSSGKSDKETKAYGDIVAVFYIEPYQGNEKALGFNIASNPARLNAIRKACDTGKMVITERIKLVQEKGESYGYLIFKSIYQKGKKIDTVAQRQAAFTGLAVGVFRFGDIFPGTAQFTPPPGIDMWINDLTATAGKQFLHYRPANNHNKKNKPLPVATKNRYEEAKTGLHWKITTRVLDREWEFLFAATPDYFNSQNLWQSLMSLIGGILITLLISIYLQSRHNQIASLAITNNELIEENKKRRRYELKAKEQRDFSNTILEASANVVVVIDLDGRIVVFNPAAEKITGFKSNEVIGVPVWETVIPPEQEPGVKNVFENLKKGNLNIASEYENEWLTKDGERRLLHWSNSVLYDNDGNINYIMALGYDITQQRENEKQQERLNRELRQAQKMESLGQLTGGIAHDFNNILGIIIGYSDLAISKYSTKVEPELIGYLQKIYEAGERASKLIAQMLTFSRGDQTKNFPIKFAPLVKDEINMLRSTLPSTIEITESIEKDLPYVYMNPTQLHQILMNLSINAADAMNGSGKLSVKLAYLKDLNAEATISHKPIHGDWVELSVTDTGPGIHPDIIRNIFDPFFTTKDVGEGTGMGLSVIYRIMKDHNGHILLETEQNKGTTFRMLFPPVISEDTPVTDIEPSVLTVQQGDNSEILIVDDEEMLAMQLSALLEHHNYNPCYVTDSRKALDIFNQDPERFVLLITDQTMPNMTGAELIEKIREIKPDFPVIMCSGYSSKIDAKKADELNFVYLEKPVDSKILLSKISELVQ